jgi:hypothetical protein
VAGSLPHFRPAPCAQLPDLFEHGIPVEEFTAVGLLGPAP